MFETKKKKGKMGEKKIANSKQKLEKVKFPAARI